MIKTLLAAGILAIGVGSAEAGSMLPNIAIEAVVASAADSANLRTSMGGSSPGWCTYPVLLRTT